MLHITFSKYDCTIIYQVWVYFHCISITLKLLQNHNYNYITSCIGVLKYILCYISHFQNMTV